ncbi:MAG: TonB-dependent receptor [Phocaeicola sp.]|uniref:TonB-dependent receptor n=1 Tax=Phocaeicola TaxID=909656 RepID=UPI00234F830D|nr:TonB-dependent receptor [Phocaeicola oris]MCE2615799.1 TonB-dependent receptor [Phocaeicola oris]
MKRMAVTAVSFMLVVLSHAQQQDTVKSMVKDGITMNEVVIIGNNNKRDVMMKSSQNLVSIGKSYIDANISGSLMQSLAGIPGVKAMNIGSGQSKPAIRGLGFNRMVVTENGIKHEGQQWGEDHGLEIDQFSIDKVEVIKGPSTLLYGSDAIGGVINLYSNYIPIKRYEGKIDLFARSNNESVGLSAQLAGKNKHFYYRANLTLIDYADYKVPADSIQYYSYYIKLKNRRLRNTAGKEYDGSFTFGYLGDNFSSSIRISDTYAKSGFFADAHGLEVRMSDIDYDRSRRDIDLPFHGVNHLKIINHSAWRWGKIHMESDLSFQNNLRKEQSEPISHGYMPIPPNTLERKYVKNTYTANVSMNTLLAEKHSLRAGLNIEYQHNKRGGWGFIIPDFETTSYGGYVYDRYHLTEDLILSAGIRLDKIHTHIHHYSDWYKTPVEGLDSIYKERSADLKRSFNSLTWSLGVNYNVGQWILKANLGKSFRAPIPKELGADGINYHIFRYEKGESKLSPEESYQFDAGINWHNDVINIQLDPYLNYFPNYIYLNPTSGYTEGLQTYYYTQSRVIRYGFEAEANYKFSRKWETGLKGEYLYAEQLSGDKKGYTLPFSPPWSIGTELKYILSPEQEEKSGFISITYKVVGDQNEIVPPEKATKGYSVLNMSIGKVFTWKSYGLKLNLQGLNLLNKRYYDHTSFYRLIDVPEPGRNFSLMIGVVF